MSHEKNVTWGNPLFPGLHCGVPALHPNGHFLLFVCERRGHPGFNISGTPPNQPFWGYSYYSIPGLGAYCDVWLSTTDGSKAWQLTSEAQNTSGTGILLVSFSHNGKMISWTMGYNCNDNCTNSGANLVMIADIILPNTTHGASLHNLRKFQPGGVDAFNEVSTFLPDDSGVIVTSSYLTRDFWHSQLYKMSFSNPEQLIPLTSDLSSYSEHPCYSPDFSMIVYMTTAGDRAIGGTDWWIMNADGSNKQQLTFFNTIGSADSARFNYAPRWADASYAWAPNMTFFLGDFQSDLWSMVPDSVIVYLPPQVLPPHTTAATLARASSPSSSSSSSWWVIPVVVSAVVIVAIVIVVLLVVAKASRSEPNSYHIVS